MYETFDHTADLGLRIISSDLDTLFNEAGCALFSTIVEKLELVQPLQQVDFEIEGDELPLLLFDWLKELLYRFDAEHMLFGRFAVHVENLKLKASAWGEPLDPVRHPLLHEVKAITYHGLRLEKTDGNWLAEVIVDI
jgi:SHS2 domain-containing protein